MSFKTHFLKFFKTQKSSHESLTFKVSDSLEQSRVKLSARIPFLKEKAVSDALRNLPDSKIKKLGTTEEEWMQQAQKVVDDAHKSVGQNVSELKEGIKIIRQKLKNFDLEDREQKVRDLHLSEKNLEIASKTAESKSEEIRLDEEINRLEREKADLTEVIYQTTSKNKTRPTRSLLHSKWVYLCSIAFLGLLELPINYFSSLAFGEASDFLNMIFCFGLGIFICIGAHFCGEGVARKNSIEIGGGFLIALFTIGTILFIRNSIGYTVILGAFNVALFLAGSLLSYNRAKNLGYFEQDSDLENISKELISRKKERSLTDKVLSKDLADIEKKFKEQARIEAWDEINTLKEQLKNSELKYKKLKTYLKGYELSIQDIFEEGINVYRTTNTRQRFGRYPEVQLWNEANSIPLLLFQYFKRKGFKKKAKITKTFSFLLPFCGFILLSSCSTSISNDFNAKVNVLIDKTEEFNIDREATIRHIEKVSGLRLESADFGISVTISTITANSFNPRHTVELKKAKNFFQGRKKSDQVKHREFFRDSLRSAFQKIYDEPVGRRESEIYASICRELNELSSSSATSKKLIIISDLLEHTANNSFYGYRNSREAFKEDWSRIEEIFKQNCSLPDLTGIDVEVIHLPDEDHDHLFLMVLDFWKHLFKKHGVNSFSHIPNL